MFSILASPTVTIIVIKKIQSVIRTTVLSKSTQTVRRWITKTLHQPTLVELLAASDNATCELQLASARKRHIWSRVLSSDKMAGDHPTYNKRSTDLHLYLALGSLGLSLVALLGVPVLTLVIVPAQSYFVARFLKSGIDQIWRERRVGMATMDALLTSTLLGLGYFWAIALYASFFYWSHRLLGQTSNRYQDSIWLAASVLPQRVRVLRNATETWIDLDTLNTDDTIVVYVGEILPVDGIVIAGLAKIDQQARTGEAAPVERSVGQQVFAMTQVLAGSIQICMDQTSMNTLSAQISDLLRGMRSYNASLMVRAEAIANHYTMPVLILSGGTLLLLGPTSALTVLCAYIGYSLRVSGPLTVLNYVHLAAQHQILVKDGTALETLHSVDTVIFDKTSTLMHDPPEAVNIYTYADYAEDEVLTLAATAEQYQIHPIARAILQAAETRHLGVRSSSYGCYEPGVGVHSRIAGVCIHVVGLRFLEQAEITLPVCAEAIQAYCYQRGHSLVYVVANTTVIGMIELAHNLRPEAQQVVAGLQQLGKKVMIVSGDYEQPVRQLAHHLQVDAYHAGMLPSDKVDLIARLQQQGETVCFVGDGLNDALALQQADVSISLQSATGLALDTAQILLLNTDLVHLLTLFDMGQQVHTRMQGNTAFSIVPGMITIAGAYLFNVGIVTAYVLYATGFAAGITNAMLPLVLFAKGK